jgi:hypothetical protein
MRYGVWGMGYIYIVKKYNEIEQLCCGKKGKRSKASEARHHKDGDISKRNTKKKKKKL